jgi:hypothetical protein
MLLVTLTLFVMLTVMEFVIELVTEFVNEFVMENEPEEVEEGMNDVEVVMVTEVVMKTVAAAFVLLFETPERVIEPEPVPADATLREVEVDPDAAEFESVMVMEKDVLMDKPQSLRTRLLLESATMTVGSVVAPEPREAASTSLGEFNPF